MNSRISYLGAALLLLGWVTLFAVIAPAQKTKAPAPTAKPPESGSVPEQSPDEEQYNISVEVQVVTVPVTVTDRKGQFITNLDKRDFTILDNGTQQTIENFELSSEPLSLAIVVESSSRVQPILSDLRGAGILVTQLMLGESGEAAVLSFDREVKTLVDFTQNTDEIETAIKKLSIGPGQTHLSDAVGRAVFLLQRRPRGRRKVILIISEARDQGSASKLGNVLRGAQQLGISVYTIGLSTMKALVERPADQSGIVSPYPPGVVHGPLPGGSLPTPDAQYGVAPMNVNMLEIISDVVTYAKNLVTGNPLAVYAAGTGGTDFATDNRSKVEKAISRIGEELRSQYLITYRPNNLSDRGYHNIRVNLSRRELETRFRPGYVVLPVSSSNAASPQPQSAPGPLAMPPPEDPPAANR